MSQATVNVINLERFKGTVLYSITLCKWGNSTRIRDLNKLEAYMELLKLETEQEAREKKRLAAEAAGETLPDEPTTKPQQAIFVASDRVKSTKTLVQSSRYVRLCRAMTALKARSEAMAMPSFVRPGMFIVKEASVMEVESILKQGWQQIQQNELKDFLAGFEQDIENAKTAPVKKGGLGPLFNEADYPTLEELEKCFSVEWFWTALSVPENIPDALKEEANIKFKRRMEDAAQQIEQALRQEFLKVISHAEEALTTQPGSKPKIFRDSLIGNIVQFVNTFESRDIFGDDRMAAVVAKAKQVLIDNSGNAKLDPQKLRDFANVRATARAEFAKLKEELSGMIVEEGRKMDLSED